MISRMRQFLAAPVFEDNEKTRAAGMLNTIQLTLLTLSMMYGIASLVLYPNPIPILIINGIVIFLSFAGLILTRQGLVRFVSVAFTTSLWGIVTFSLYVFGGVRGPSISGYFVVILVASLLMSGRAVIVFTALGALAGLLILHAETANLLPPSPLPTTPGSSWTLTTIILIVVAIMLRLVIKRYNDILKNAGHNEQKLLTEVRERAKTEEALRESVSLLEGTLESTTDGILVVDMRGKITNYNKKFIEMWNIPEEVIASKDDEKVLSFVMDQLCDPDMFIKKVRELYGKPRKESSDVLHFKNGRILERYSFPHQVEDHVIGRVWIFRNVTERVKAEGETRRLSQFLDSVIENANVWVNVLDENAHVVIWNKASEEISGYSKEEVLGHGKIWEWLYPDEEYRNEILATVEEIIRKKGSEEKNAETIITRKDGQTRLISWYSRNLVDENGKPMGSIALGRDITERKRVEEALQQRKAQLEALQQMGLELAAELSLDALLNSIVFRAVELIRATTGGLYLYRPEKNVLEWVVGIGPYGPPIGTMLCKGEGLSGKVWETGKPLIVDNYQQWEEGISVLKDEPLGSSLGVPIQWGTELLGVLVIATDKAAAFSQDDAELLGLFATQAAIALRNAHLFEEAQRRTEEITALREITLATLSTLERDQVFEVMLDQLGKVIDYDNAIIKTFTPDGKEETIAARGTTVHDQAMWEGFDAQERRLTQKMRKARKPVVIHDSHTDKRKERSGEEETPHSWAGAPLFMRDELIGYLMVEKASPDFYHERTVQLLADFAHAAAIAIEKIHLFEETRTRAERLALVNRIAKAAGATLDLDDLLKTVYQEVVPIFRFDSFFIALYDEEANEIDFRIWIDEDVWSPPARKPLGTGLTSLVVSRKEPLLIRDLEKEKDYFTSVLLFGTMKPPRSWLGVPMLTGDRVIGIINVQAYRPNVWNEEDKLLLFTIADQIAVAVENARLYETAQQELAERKRAEESLRTSEQRFALAVQGTNEGLWDWDIANDSLYWSPRLKELLGYGDEEIDPNLGNFLEKIVHPEDRERVRVALEAHLKEREPYYIEQRQCTKSGEYRWFLVRGQAVWDEDGKPIRMVGSTTDITERKRAEEALQISEERYALAVRGSNDGIWDWDMKTNTLYWSPRFKELLGYDPDELEAVFETFESHLHPDDRERIQAAIDAHLKDQVIYDVEERLKTKSGEYRWFRARGQALWDKEGNPIRFSGSITDITERKQAEEALRISEERFDLAVGGANDGIWDWVVRNDKVEKIYWSPRLKELLGYADDELEVDEGTFDRLLHPDDRERIWRAIETNFKDRTPYDVEERLLTKSGEYRWFRARGRTVWDKDGNALRFSGSLTDITEQKQSEERLAATHALGQKLVLSKDVSEIAQSVVDAAWQVLHIPICGLWLVDEEEGLLVRRAQSGANVPDMPPLPLDSERGIVVSVVRSGESIYVKDVSKDDRYIGVHSRSCSELCVPLRVGERIIGVLNAESDKMDSFSPADRQLLEGLANAATIAIENARLFEETRIRAKEQAVLYELSQALTAHLSADEVLEEIYRQTSRLVDTTNFYVALHNPDLDEIFIPLSIVEGKRVNTTRRRAKKGLTEYIIKTKKPLLIKEDIPGCRKRLGIEALGKQGAQSWLGVPMIVGKRVIGIMAVQSYTIPGLYDEHDRDLLMAIANPTAIAIQNAQLFQESQKRTEEISALRGVNLAILSTLEREKFFDIMLDELKKVIDYDNAGVKILTEDGIEKMIAAKGPVVHDKEMWEGYDWKESKIIKEMLETRKVVVVNDSHTDERYEKVGDWKGYRSWVGAPLYARDELLGYLMIEKAPPDFYGTKAIQLLEDFAQAAAIALENIRLYENIRQELNERKKAEEALKRYATKLEWSNRELEEFAYIASHDLQEPLRKVQAFGDRLKAKYSESLGDQGQDYLMRMQSAAIRMQTLINGLLTYSRVTTKAQPFVSVDLSQVAKDVISDLEVRIEQVHGRVEVEKLPTIEADPTQMLQLLQNLVGNALKFRREDEPPVVKLYSKILDVSTKDTTAKAPSNGLCQIFVEDNGIGFHEQYADTIFQVFRRLHGRDQYEGSGVGLATCRKIVERHGGTITAKSRPGEGSCFIVALPLKQPKEEKVKEV